MTECKCISYNRRQPGQIIPPAELPQSLFFPDTKAPTVYIDACIAGVITELWAAGIRTGGSCCSHNGTMGPAPSVVIMDPKDAEKTAAILADDPRNWQVMFWAGGGDE